jgi:P2 family phage major capsid protein
MKKHSLLAFSVMMASMAKTYGVEDVSKDFTVTPEIQQTLQTKITDSADFLKQINMLLVEQIKGEKILGAVNNVPGSRTDTSTTGERTPANILALTSQLFECFKTDFDVALRYSTIDAWAKFPDFAQRYSEWVMKQRALAMIMVGWNGESAAADTDADANPLGQDVNIGWYELIRNYNTGSQFVEEGVALSGDINIGPAGDYVNIDSAAYDLKMMIDAKYRTDLVVIIGEELMADERAKAYAALGATPTEKEKLELQAVARTFGGMPAVDNIPYFPGRGLMVTSLKNLSIYQQEGSQRRSVVDNAKKDQVEDYNCANIGYVIENEEACAALEFKNVKLWNGSAFA